MGLETLQVRRHRVVVKLVLMAEDRCLTQLTLGTHAHMGGEREIPSPPQMKPYSAYTLKGRYK